MNRFTLTLVALVVFSASITHAAKPLFCNADFTGTYSIYEQGSNKASTMFSNVGQVTADGKGSFYGWMVNRGFPDDVECRFNLSGVYSVNSDTSMSFNNIVETAFPISPPVCGGSTHFTNHWTGVMTSPDEIQFSEGGGATGLGELKRQHH
jgi:hypothetical protein